VRHRRATTDELIAPSSASLSDIEVEQWWLILELGSILCERAVPSVRDLQGSSYPERAKLGRMLHMKGYMAETLQC